MQIILKVNELDLSGIAIDAVTSSGLEDGTIESRMEAILHSDCEVLRYVDLRGTVTLAVVQDGQRHPVFRGIINFAQEEGTTYRLKCRDHKQLLHETKAGGGFGAGVLPAEIVYYLISEITREGVDPHNFHISDTETLADTGRVSRMRRFVYIAPIPSCTLKDGAGIIRMVNTWLYNASENASADDRAVESFDSPDGAWKKSDTRVRFYVQARDFLEALEKGGARLQRLLDVISFGANYASPTYPTRTGPRLFSYDRSRTLIDVQETEWAFVRDTTAADRFWMHWGAPHRHSQPFFIEPQDPILSLYEILQELAEEDQEELSGKERALLNALHALRQTRQSADAKDALDHVWRCMEFLLAGYSTDALFSERERKMLVSAAKLALDESNADGTNPRIAEQKQRLENIINQQLNQTPLRTKWKLFCAAHFLRFPEDDEKFLWTLRRNRNDHQHGRSTAVSRLEIDRAAILMEKALIAAVVDVAADNQEF